MERRRLLIAGVMAVVLGCDEASPSGESAVTDAASADATGIDAAALDAAALDEGPVDAAPADAVPADLTPPDATPGDADLVPVVLEDVRPLGVCDTPRRVYPLLPDEAGHWAVERLVPEATPTIVEGVQYQLVGPDPDEGPQCRTALPHRVFVTVGPDGAPPAAPSAGERFREFDMRLPDQLLVGADVVFETPVVLHAGEALFVGIEMAAQVEDEHSLCLGACSDSALVARSYWSNSTDEPFPWGDLVADFGLTENYTIRAYGRAPR